MPAVTNDLVSPSHLATRTPAIVIASPPSRARSAQETPFFGDANLFAALRRHLIPELISHNAKRRTIRIWSAACAGGQEPYSIAMLIRESFPQLADWTIQIVASDISKELLHRARAGVYGSGEIRRGLDRHQLPRFLDRKGDYWQFKQELRDLVEFYHLDLTHPWPYLGQFDITVLTNVLDRFDRQTQTDVLKRVRGTLRPDGYLLIGAAESLVDLCVPYQRYAIDHTVAYRPSTI